MVFSLSDFRALAAMWWDTRSENARDPAEEKVSHFTATALIFQRSYCPHQDVTLKMHRYCPTTRAADWVKMI
jgi:hypothetical protein